MRKESHTNMVTFEDEWSKLNKENIPEESVAISLNFKFNFP
jgi:hypothetical protein